MYTKEIYQVLFDSAPDAVILVNTEGKILLVNRQVEVLFDYMPDELIGQEIEILIPERYRQIHKHHRSVYDQNPLFRGMGVGLELLARRKNGSAFPVEISLSPVKVEEQFLFSASIRDVSVRKELEEHKNYFQNITDNVPVMIWISRADGYCTYLNQQWYSYTGQDEVSGLGFGWLSAVHPDDSVFSEAYFLEANQKQIPFTLVFRLKDKNDNYRWMIDTGLPKFNVQGVFEGYVGAVIDIHQRKLTEETLEKTQRHLKLALSAGAVGTWNWNLVSDRVVIDEGLAKLVGLSMQESLVDLSYKDFSRYIHPEDLPKVEKLIAASLEKAQPFEALYRVKWQNNSWRWVISRGMVEKDRLGTPIYFAGTTLDISERKIAEDEAKDTAYILKEYARELQARNKELEQFAYLSSHDLQEPLRTIRSCVDFLVADYKDQLDETAQNYFQFLAESSERMHLLIRGLLDYSRLGKNKDLHWVDCNRILTVLQADLDTLIRESGAVFCLGLLPTVQGYELELKILFQNLIVNAIKFRKKNHPPKIIIQAEQQEKNWLFEVKDNGIGIEERFLDKVFVIFKRLHSRTEYEGTGIGLAHCKKIIELHKGKIWVESQVGEGSTFKFEIPHYQVDSDS